MNVTRAYIISLWTLIYESAGHNYLNLIHAQSELNWSELMVYQHGETLYNKLSVNSQFISYFALTSLVEIQHALKVPLYEVT